ncbi:MAG: helix-turn-helix domain-containing protein [Planctomycetota bacterium]
MDEKRHTSRHLDDYLQVGQAAAFFGVSRSTLRNWGRSAKLKASRHPLNGYRLYRKADLQALLQALENDKS